MAIENTSQDLADFLATKNYDVKYTDSDGQDASPAEAKIFAFDWIAPSSDRNYGTVVIVLGDENNLQLFFGDNMGKTMDDPEDKADWFGSENRPGFFTELKNFATQHRYIFSPENLNKLKHTMQGMAAIKEGLFEGYYGTKKISYVGEQTDARLLIRHSKAIHENDKRFRHIESLFIETADGERFKLPFTKLTAGRAMLEHVRQGGKPYDIRGQHISEIVTEMAVLSRFNRASQNRVFENQTQQLVNTAQSYYQQLKEDLQQISTGRGYQSYFESWTPADIGEQSALVEDLKTMFIEQTLDARIEAALPTLAKLQHRGQTMKEADIFESWVNKIAEGIWALPDTPEAQEKLQELMSRELIVGPDAINATEQLYDIIGDDELFDILSDLAQRDPRANIWDDTDVQERLAELGIQTPESTETQPADVDQDTAPKNPTAEAEETDGELAARKIQTPAYVRRAKGGDDWKTSTQDLEKAKERTHSGPEGLRALTQRLGLGEDQDLRRIRELAKLPVKESVLTDSTGHTLDHILTRFGKEYRDWQQTGNLEGDFYEALYDYYFDDMPYGTKKARTGDPYEWISDRLARDKGLNEADPMDTFETGMMDLSMGEQIQGMEEAKSCNMTAEGEYCPEHGLAECGYMEASDDPINANSAIAGSFYESELDRIKKLALNK